MKSDNQVQPVNLTQRPSYLIEKALGDFIEVSKDPSYSYDDGYWHYPHPEIGKILYSFAGALMAKTLKVSKGTVLSAYSSDMKPYQKQLVALDKFSQGSIVEGLGLLGAEKGDFANISVPDPVKEREKFIKTMNGLAKNLREKEL